VSWSANDSLVIKIELNHIPKYGRYQILFLGIGLGLHILWRTAAIRR
jgi:hypothetical protein